MPWAAIAAIAGLASAGTGIGLDVAQAVDKPKTPALTPAPAPTQVNPQQAYGALANQQSSAPGANSGLVENQLQSILGLGANSAVTSPGSFQAAGIGNGTGNPVQSQAQIALSDWFNQQA